MYNTIISRIYTLLYDYKLNIKFIDDLAINKVRFAKMILLRLIVYHLVKLKHCYSELLKNNCIFKQNWSKVEIFLHFI